MKQFLNRWRAVFMARGPLPADSHHALLKLVLCQLLCIDVENRSQQVDLRTQPDNLVEDERKVVFSDGDVSHAPSLRAPSPHSNRLIVDNQHVVAALLWRELALRRVGAREHDPRASDREERQRAVLRRHERDRRWRLSIRAAFDAAALLVGTGCSPASSCATRSIVRRVE